MNQTEDRARISAEKKLKLIKNLYVVDMFLNGSLLGKELTKDQKHLLVKDFGYDRTDIIATEYILREYVQNMPLSVQVRSAWETPLYGLSPYEYNIELLWGGPALRIVGTLNRYTEPADASLEYQDYYTKWQEYDCDTDELMWFASCFNFG
jgi:hypothetical protein